MQLTYFTDYCFRVLIYLAQHPDQKATIDQLQDYFGISRNHLVKVVHWLGQHEYVTTRRGKGGGILLGGDPAGINVGEVFKQAEQRLDLVECMGDNCECRIVQQCGLQGVIRAGLAAFVQVVDGYSLADVSGLSAETQTTTEIVIEPP
ncbi:MAG: BadM/Rrf2 family transcriptional regulator [Gammaproteobacteria bacterium]|nr:MAG: BadM/Rrf2 family transcriptional regulator [Gammaproteobacteria bacterium]RLA17763.1 MAG: BadM/Rrf2 family transcriptional regulator [Gammaproteobacteria bacterium]